MIIKQLDDGSALEAASGMQSVAATLDSLNCLLGVTVSWLPVVTYGQLANFALTTDRPARRVFIYRRDYSIDKPIADLKVAANHDPTPTCQSAPGTMTVRSG
jgi:hypothetical protein